MNAGSMKGMFFGVLGASILLVGCGGGGGGGGSTFTPPNISNTPVTIDSDNQYEVAGVAADGVSGSIDGGLGAIGVVAGGNGRSFSAFDFAKKTVLSLGDVSLTAGLDSPTGVEFTENCDVAPDGSRGTITLSTNVADLQASQSLGVGDYVSMSSSNCYDAFDGETVSGSVRMTIVSGSLDFNLADPLSAGLSIAVSFNNLRSTEMGETSIVHGDATLTASGTSFSLSGDSLYVMTVGGEAVHLTNFAISSTDFGTYESITVDATIASTEIDGVISIRTDPSDPLLEDTFASHPRAGTMIITGGSTTLTMVIQTSTSVVLYLDADGVPGTDAGYPVTVTWTEIDNGAALVP